MLVDIKEHPGSLSGIPIPEVREYLQDVISSNPNAGFILTRVNCVQGGVNVTTTLDGVSWIMKKIKKD